MRGAMIGLILSLAACGGSEPHSETPEPIVLPPDTPAPGGAIATCEPRGGSGGTTGPCTEMGCQSGFRIELAPDRAWPPGHYRFALTADGRSYACEGDLPLRPCDQGQSLSCDAPWFGVGESGCALPI